MLISKKPKHRKRPDRLYRRKTVREVSLFHFPAVIGIEDVSAKLSAVEADSLFSALLYAFRLRPIETRKEASEAERVLEYIERAFPQDFPIEIENYRQILLMLVEAFNDKYYIRARDTLEPHEFLKTLLHETGISQKALVPDCFKSASQVSEFLHQRKGRKQLSFQQAVALGLRFGVEPQNFLRV